MFLTICQVGVLEPPPNAEKLVSVVVERVKIEQLRLAHAPAHVTFLVFFMLWSLRLRIRCQELYFLREDLMLHHSAETLERSVALMHCEWNMRSGWIELSSPEVPFTSVYKCNKSD